MPTEQAPETSPSTSPIVPPGAGRMLAAVLIAVFVVPLSVSGTAVALTAIARDLGNDPTGEQWALNAFNVTFAASTLAWGSLADRVGRARAFQCGGALFILGSAASLFAPTYAVLDLARGLAGLGAGAVFSVGSAMLSVAFAGTRRSRVFALMGAVAGLSLAFGPTLSGLLTQVCGWRGIFALQGILLVGAAALLLRVRAVLGGEPRAHSAFDWPAAVLFFGIVAGFVGALVLASNGQWLSPIVLAGAAAACLTGLWLRERRVEYPLLNLRVLARLRFLGTSLVVAVASFTFAALVTYAPSLLQVSWSVSPAFSGAFVMFMTAPTLIAPLIAGVLVAHGVAPRMVLTVAMVLMVAGTAGLSFAAGAGAGILAPIMVLLGAGFGLHAGLVDNEALAAAPAADAGLAAGWVNTLRVGTEAMAVSLFGAFYVPALGGADDAGDVGTGVLDRVNIGIHGSVNADALGSVGARMLGDGAVDAFRTVGLLSAAIALVIAILSIAAMRART